MRYKVGDKVSFLNEARNGIVRKIINAQMVSVEIEDGFEIPVLCTDLVKIETSKDDLSDRKAPALDVDAYFNQEENDDDSLSQDLYIDEKKQFPKGLYLAYVPENKSNLASGNMTIMFINYTDYELLFTYAIEKENKFIDEDYDLTGAETSYLMNELNVSQINEWSKIKFQVIYFNKGKINLKKPLIRTIELNPVKIYRENSYKYCSLINKKCILVPFDQVGGDFNWEEAEDNNQEFVEKGTEIKQELENANKLEVFPQQFIVEKGIAEIDIHIWQLTNNYRNMTNGEIVTLQKNYFRRYLDLAISNKLEKIVFIHGVGNGTLKNEIRTVLENSYPNLEFRDASMAKYGVGATEVVIPYNYKG